MFDSVWSEDEIDIERTLFQLNEVLSFFDFFFVLHLQFESQ